MNIILYELLIILLLTNCNRLHQNLNLLNTILNALNYILMNNGSLRHNAQCVVVMSQITTD